MAPPPEIPSSPEVPSETPAEKSPETPEKDSASPEPLPGPPPRAFAQGTGVLLQTVGMLLFLSNCCICSLAGIWEPLQGRSQINKLIAEHGELGLSLSDLVHDPRKAGMMLMVMFGTVGGLALAGFGLGLQSDRRGAAGALGTNAGMLAVLSLAGVALWAGGASLASMIWLGLLLVLMAGLLPFTIGAVREYRKTPPPREPDLLPPGFDIRDVLRGEKPSKLKIKELRAKLEIERKQLERLERELEKQGGGDEGEEEKK